MERNINMLVSKLEQNMILDFREKERIKGIVERAEESGKYNKYDINTHVRLMCKNERYGKFDGEIAIVQGYSLCNVYTKDELALDVFTRSGIITIPLRMCIAIRKREPEWVEI